MAGARDANTGALFKAKSKNSENSPDYNGSMTIECPQCNGIHDYWLSAWLKTAGPNAKNPGMKFFSFAMDPKDGGLVSPGSMTAAADAAGRQAAANAEKKAEEAAVDDDIPF